MSATSGERVTGHSMIHNIYCYIDRYLLHPISVAKYCDGYVSGSVSLCVCPHT